MLTEEQANILFEWINARIVLSVLCGAGSIKKSLPEAEADERVARIQMYEVFGFEEHELESYELASASDKYVVAQHPTREDGYAVYNNEAGTHWTDPQSGKPRYWKIERNAVRFAQNLNKGLI